MPTLEERVAYLEGRFGEQVGLIADLRDSIRLMDQRLDAKIDRLDAKVDRQFVWTIGIQVTVLLAVIGTLLSSFTSGGPEGPPLRISMTLPGMRSRWTNWVVDSEVERIRVYRRAGHILARAQELTREMHDVPPSKT